MGISARIRIDNATLDGQILHQGQRARFQARVDGPKVDATFEQHPESEKPIDEWELFRLLESFIDRHMRG